MAGQGGHGDAHRVAGRIVRGKATELPAHFLVDYEECKESPDECRSGMFDFLGDDGPRAKSEGR